jgi:hypothetical protein
MPLTRMDGCVSMRQVAGPSASLEQDAAVGNNFVEVDASADFGLSVFEATRTSCLPPLIVRRARIEDHDDLLPVLQRGVARHPDLAQLPSWCAAASPPTTLHSALP